MDNHFFKGNMPKRLQLFGVDMELLIGGVTSTCSSYLHSVHSSSTFLRRNTSIFLYSSTVLVFLLSLLIEDCSSKPIKFQQDQGPHPTSHSYFKKISSLADNRRLNSTKAKINDGKLTNKPI